MLMLTTREEAVLADNDFLIVRLLGGPHNTKGDDGVIGGWQGSQRISIRPETER